VTYPAIASRAGVSRTFLYDNPAARDLISAAITRTAHAEIRAQRARISELLGELRDTQREQNHDALQRLTAENTTLKQRLRQLTSDQRAMEEKLQAARSNNRFLDKRIAGLEAQLLDAGMSRRT
jgi:predicted nuclease with TOPRIM domain